MQRQRNPTALERLSVGIDRVIGVFAPGWAARRAMNRLNMRLTSAYESVPTWRNSSDWLPTDGKGEAINAPSRDLARSKARHLERNSELVNSILNAFERNVVGKGFNLQVRTDDVEWNNEVEDLWAEWCRPGNCDVTGRFISTRISPIVTVDWWNKKQRIVYNSTILCFCLKMILYTGV